jgi:hypothetical protein
VVPFEHAEMLAASYPAAEFWEIEGYGHVEACSHSKYRQRLLVFWREQRSERPRRGTDQGTQQ